MCLTHTSKEGDLKEGIRLHFKQPYEDWQQAVGYALPFLDGVSRESTISMIMGRTSFTICKFSRGWMVSLEMSHTDEEPATSNSALQSGYGLPSLFFFFFLILTLKASCFRGISEEPLRLQSH